MFNAICYQDDSEYIKQYLFIRGIDFDGIANVEAMENQDLDDLADVLSGCFNPKSNAFLEINKAFEKESNYKIIGFSLLVDGVSVIVNRATCQPEKIVNRWWGRYRMTK